MRKKYLGAFLCLMLFVFTGCSGKPLEESRVYEDRFTFTASEFEELYNESVSRSKKISGFDERKLENYEIYNSYAIFDRYTITAETDTSGGKIIKVKYRFKGGVESPPTSSTPWSTITYTSGELNSFYKYSVNVFKTVSPNTTVNEYKTFFDSKITRASFLKKDSIIIGDVHVEFDPTYGMDIVFTPAL